MVNSFLIIFYMCERMAFDKVTYCIDLLHDNFLAYSHIAVSRAPMPHISARANEIQCLMFISVDYQ